MFTNVVESERFNVGKYETNEKHKEENLEHLRDLVCGYLIYYEENLKQGQTHNEATTNAVEGKNLRWSK